jgi:ArsR family transcriptional regulator, arsenate/arsenite/antimonite-responsive transcriptional repressor
MATAPITIEPRRPLGQACCAPRVLPHLDEHAARDAATLFKALSDPTRLQILDILAQHTGHVCVCDFEGVVGVPDETTGKRLGQSTISHHLKILRDAGVVGYTKQGQWAYYFVHRNQLERAQAILAALR